MAVYKFGKKIEVAVSKIRTPQDWLIMEVIAHHANDTFLSHYNDIEENRKKLKRKSTRDEDKKVIEDQISIDSHLAHLWWLHNVKNTEVDNLEYTKFISSLYEKVPETLKVEPKEWMDVCNSIIWEYGPKLVEKKEEN